MRCRPRPARASGLWRGPSGASLLVSPLHVHVPFRLIRAAAEGGAEFHGAPFTYALHGFDVPTEFSASGFVANCALWALATIPLTWWLARRLAWSPIVVTLLIGIGAGLSMLTVTAAAGHVGGADLELNPFAHQVDEQGQRLSTGSVRLEGIQVRYVFESDGADRP